MTSTMSVPTTALGKRHPSGSKPKTCSPAPISHLPTSGCTTIAGSPWVSSGVRAALEDRVVGVVAPADAVAVAPQRPAVLGVVGLVEEEVARAARGSRTAARPASAVIASVTTQPTARSVSGRPRSRLRASGTARPSAVRDRPGPLAAPSAVGASSRSSARPAVVVTAASLRAEGGRRARSRAHRPSWAGERTPGAGGHPDRTRRGRLGPAASRSSPPPTWSPPRTPAGCAG